MALTKRERRLKIKQRIRKRISGTNERPRMTVFRSNKQIYVQLVNDLTGETVVSASSKNKEVADKKNISKSEQAKLVGKLVAERSLAKGINNVVFDRNGYLYHGRIRILAESAREGGLKI
ncbi:MAG: 50S ribosomal protein L18 [Bacteroidales bacterium]|nr:50S ribosomal protein L18 [Bacteroidales bacterium]